MWNYNYFIYIITNYQKSTLYIGVTNDLERRLDEHKANSGTKYSFAGKYYCSYLVHYERYTHIEQAIEREKELKKWSRKKKEMLINENNSDWKFLNEEIKSK